jgi:hypothetical protein
MYTVRIHLSSSEFRFLLRPARDDVGNLCIPYYQHASCSCNISSSLLQDTIREHCRIGRYPTNQGARDGVARVEKGLAVCAFSLARVDSGFRREQR